MEICLKTWKIMINKMLMKSCKSNDLSDKDTISGKKLVIQCFCYLVSFLPQAVYCNQLMALIGSFVN